MVAIPYAAAVTDVTLVPFRYIVPPLFAIEIVLAEFTHTEMTVPTASVLGTVTVSSVVIHLPLCAADAVTAPVGDTVGMLRYPMP